MGSEFIREPRQNAAAQAAGAAQDGSITTKSFPHSEVVDDSKSFKDNSERQTQKDGLSPSNRQLRRWTSEELIMVR